MTTNHKTSFTLLLAVAASAWLALSPARAATPNYGAYAGVYGGSRMGGEGSFSAMANTLPTHGKYSYGWGQALLGDGTLHAASGATPCPSCHAKTGTNSVARYWDTVTFHNGKNLGLVELSVSIDGTLTPGNSQASARFYVGHAHADFFDHLDAYAPAVALASGTTVLGDELFVPLGDATYFVFAELTTSAVALPYAGSPNASADFGNTLHFRWTLPDGVTTSSASGQFMTAAVPEPSSWMMAGTGLLALGWLQRRRGLRR
ncbi:PEP-CTERM sorting domain-containing protein [Pelomonas sp. Root1444]|uniref:PEP-CTERM sorting domain-containing protein n=1 Tax=Pelomonas sp. Root1444 TaxID=1736464 RepID=UPI00070382A8|nr:PEP-CTERM sorting domain-containing protein [Pelomonas sp. Root1444]KQY88515.1 hypothetical protein ASD35_13220 [Pelomonas sp. Root1444]